MKPRTKKQKYIYSLAQKLPKLTKTQEKWAKINVLEHYGVMNSQNEVTCLDCGNVYHAKYKLTDKTTEIDKCPHCKTKLIVSKTRKRIFEQKDFFYILDTVEDFQVIRSFYVSSYARRSEKKTEFTFIEVQLLFMDSKGKYTFISKNKTMGYNWAFSLSSYLEIRENYSTMLDAMRCDFSVYPKMKILPILERNGFKGDLHKVPPFVLFESILTSNRAETLLKVGYGGLIAVLKKIKYWESLLVCIRHKYKISVEDFDIWRDYLDLLSENNNDIKNPKYICPEDLHREHDRLTKRVNKIREEEDKKKKKEKAIEDKEKFNKRKGMFFGIVFENEDIRIKVIDSIEEVIQEGDEMKHCVFTNNYHLKENSLILSAQLKEDNKRLETIELSLNPLKIEQCRGKFNKSTEYHDKILELMNSNLGKIKRITRKKQLDKIADYEQRDII